MTFVLLALLFGGCSATGENPVTPTDLRIEFLEGAEVRGIPDPNPEFSWVVHSSEKNDVQRAFRVLVASDRSLLNKDQGDLWDSGRIDADQSINVTYEGKALSPGGNYVWKVKTWTGKGVESAWSEPQTFQMAEDLQTYSTAGYPVVKSKIEPAAFHEMGKGHFFIDFGRAAAGTVHLTLSSPTEGHTVVFHLGEKTSGPRTVDREPGGTIRYREIPLELKKGTHTYELEIPPHSYNRGKRVLKMPAEIGEVMPFRYVEIENVPEVFSADDIIQVAVHYPFDEEASAFTSSDDILNQIWDLCHYSIKATSYCGLYIDGDRERFPREADAYINQISHYNVDSEYTLGRRTHEFMMTHTSQWTEWMLHSVIMAWTDYQYTGNTESLARFYEDLKHKTLTALAREDGLISTTTGLVNDELRKALHYYEGEHVKGKNIVDIVDWPRNERDGHQFGDINTVVNAFHYRALVLMAEIAEALSKENDAKAYADQAARVRQSINEKLFDPEKGIYVDGEGEPHSSLHANMFPLALGVVPEEHHATVLEFIRSRGMRCSVYGAQYLLEALYAAGADEYALSLMTSREKRSWYNMIRAGSTISLEAWDIQFKGNLDWNHAWGAAPANIIPRFLLGVRPLEPGFGRVLIQPQPGTLKEASGTIPTIRGPVKVSFRNNERFELNLEIPANMTARVGIPQRGSQTVVLVNGGEVSAELIDGTLWIDEIGSGSHTFVSGHDD